MLLSNSTGVIIYTDKMETYTHLPNTKNTNNKTNKNKNKNKTNKQTKTKTKRQKTNKTILCNISRPFNLCLYSYCFILGVILNIYL